MNRVAGNVSESFRPGAQFGKLAASAQRGGNVPEIACRQARLDDAAAIHALLLRLAPEIPLLVETLEREEALYALIRNCARSGESWVAADPDGRIAGFVLVEPNQQGRHYAENEVLDLRFVAVAADHRGQGVGAELVTCVLARMVAVSATVPAQNRSGIARRLEALGFHRSDAAGGELRLRWDPGTASG